LAGLSLPTNGMSAPQRHSGSSSESGASIRSNFDMLAPRPDYVNGERVASVK
jgi:hypothetical protein